MKQASLFPEIAATDEAARKSEFYPTREGWLVRALWEAADPPLDASGLNCEMAVGRGDLVRHVVAVAPEARRWVFCELRADALVDAGRAAAALGLEVTAFAGDFLGGVVASSCTAEVKLFISNTPNSLAGAFLLECRRRAPAADVALLVPLAFVTSGERAQLLRDVPLDVYPLGTRPSFDGVGTDPRDHAWVLAGPARGGRIFPPLFPTSAPPVVCASCGRPVRGACGALLGDGARCAAGRGHGPPHIQVCSTCVSDAVAEKIRELRRLEARLAIDVGPLDRLALDARAEARARGAEVIQAAEAFRQSAEEHPEEADKLYAIWRGEEAPPGRPSGEVGEGEVIAAAYTQGNPTPYARIVPRTVAEPRQEEPEVPAPSPVDAWRCLICECRGGACAVSGGTCEREGELCSRCAVLVEAGRRVVREACEDGEREGLLDIVLASGLALSVVGNEGALVEAAHGYAVRLVQAEANRCDDTPLPLWALNALSGERNRPRRSEVAARAEQEKEKLRAVAVVAGAAPGPGLCAGEKLSALLERAQQRARRGQSVIPNPDHMAMGGDATTDEMWRLARKAAAADAPVLPAASPWSRVGADSWGRDDLRSPGSLAAYVIDRHDGKPVAWRVFQSTNGGRVHQEGDAQTAADARAAADAAAAGVWELRSEPKRHPSGDVIPHAHRLAMEDARVSRSATDPRGPQVAVEDHLAAESASEEEESAPAHAPGRPRLRGTCAACGCPAKNHPPRGGRRRGSSLDRGACVACVGCPGYRPRSAEVDRQPRAAAFSGDQITQDRAMKRGGDPGIMPGSHPEHAANAEGMALRGTDDEAPAVTCDRRVTRRRVRSTSSNRGSVRGNAKNYPNRSNPNHVRSEANMHEKQAAGTTPRSVPDDEGSTENQGVEGPSENSCDVRVTDAPAVAEGDRGVCQDAGGGVNADPLNSLAHTMAVRVVEGTTEAQGAPDVGRFPSYSDSAPPWLLTAWMEVGVFVVGALGDFDPHVRYWGAGEPDRDDVAAVERVLRALGQDKALLVSRGLRMVRRALPVAYARSRYARALLDGAVASDHDAQAQALAGALLAEAEVVSSPLWRRVGLASVVFWALDEQDRTLRPDVGLEEAQVARWRDVRRRKALAEALAVLAQFLRRTDRSPAPFALEKLAKWAFSIGGREPPEGWTWWGVVQQLEWIAAGGEA